MKMVNEYCECRYEDEWKSPKGELIKEEEHWFCGKCRTPWFNDRVAAKYCCEEDGDRTT